MLDSSPRQRTAAPDWRYLAIMSALECLMKHDDDLELRPHVRRRYLELSDPTNVATLERKS